MRKTEIRSVTLSVHLLILSSFSRFIARLSVGGECFRMKKFENKNNLFGGN
jgi:hypothetical protein